MGLIKTAKPDATPVSLAEAKMQNNLLHTLPAEEQALLELYIQAAIATVENRSNVQLCTATYQLTLAGFPNDIALPKYPVQQVTSITYLDSNGVEQELDNWITDTTVNPAKIYPAYGESWPATRQHPNGVTITFDAGFGDPEDVPADIKGALLFWIGHLFTNREPVVTGTIATALPLTFEYLLSQYELRGIY